MIVKYFKAEMKDGRYYEAFHPLDSPVTLKKTKNYIIVDRESGNIRWVRLYRSNIKYLKYSQDGRKWNEGVKNIK